MQIEGLDTRQKTAAVTRVWNQETTGEDCELFLMIWTGG